MSFLGNILQQVEGSDVVANLASKVGISPDQVQSMGGSLLGKLQGEDATETAAADLATPVETANATGEAAAEPSPADDSGGLISKLGGLAGAGGVTGTIGNMLDRDGDGNPTNDVLGMVKGFFGSKT